MFINFLCLCPLRVAIMLSFNISKVAYSERRYLGFVTRSIAGEHCVIRNICVQGYTFIVQRAIDLIHDTRHQCTRLNTDTPRVFSLKWPASMQIYRNRRKHLRKKRVQLPQDWFGTPTWRPFHCFGTPIWPP